MVIIHYVSDAEVQRDTLTAPMEGSEATFLDRIGINDLKVYIERQICQKLRPGKVQFTLIIDFKKQCEDADKILMYLDPFPETHNGIFDKLQHTLKNETVRIDTADKLEGSLLSVIVRFVKNDPVTRRVESLEQLFKGLKNNRQEIATMLQKMNEGRGFSEEASKSILHQLITNLLEVSFSKGIIKCIQNV